MTSRETLMLCIASRMYSIVLGSYTLPVALFVSAEFKAVFGVMPYQINWLTPLHLVETFVRSLTKFGSY